MQAVMKSTLLPKSLADLFIQEILEFDLWPGNSEDEYWHNVEWSMEPTHSIFPPLHENLPLDESDYDSD